VAQEIPCGGPQQEIVRGVLEDPHSPDGDVDAVKRIAGAVGQPVSKAAARFDDGNVKRPWRRLREVQRQCGTAEAAADDRDVRGLITGHGVTTHQE
jgi:hypothetical protein